MTSTLENEPMSGSEALRQSAQPGVLYIVPTPIGNLRDITQRALDILASVDWVAAEDTRHSKRLFDYFGLSVKSLSLHQHNEAQRGEMLTQKLIAGESVALISDAGTPLISDPGYVLVKLCRDKKIPVVALPGPCAAITALSASGLPTERFQFVGFLPTKQQALYSALTALANADMTSVCYEAPRRVLDTISHLVEILPENQTVVLAKELTKTFEIYVSGSAADVQQWLLEDERHQKGEFVLMVAAKQATEQTLPEEALALMKLLSSELPPKKAAGVVASHYGLKKNQVYNEYLTLGND